MLITGKSSVVLGFEIPIETEERVGAELVIVTTLLVTSAPKEVPSDGVTITYHSSPLVVWSEGRVLPTVPGLGAPFTNHANVVPDSASPSTSSKTYVATSGSVVLAVAGVIKRLLIEGGLFVGALPSEIWYVAVSHTSFELPPVPSAAFTATSIDTTPEPVDGAVQSTLQLL